MIAEFDHPLWCSYASDDEILPAAERERDAGRVSRQALRTDAFACSRERFEYTLTWLAGQDAAGLTHDELEAPLDVDARESLRVLLQDHLDLRAEREVRVEQVACAEGGPSRLRGGRAPAAPGDGARGGRGVADRLPRAWPGETCAPPTRC